MKRRDFIQKSSIASFGLALPSIGLPSIIARNALRLQRPVSLLIKGGLVFTGDGKRPRYADVAIDGGRIITIAQNIDAPGSEVIDARGMAVCPGFIDVHSHTDLSLLINPFAESKIRQGVTTEVAGQDGSSIGPWSPDSAQRLHERYKSQHAVDIDFDDLPSFFNYLRRESPSVNFASMVGAGTIRGRVIGNEDRPATPDELDAMKAYVSEAIDAGACGLSTGLEYIPGAFASIDELVHLCGPLQLKMLPYASHMRNEDNELLAAIEEALTIGQRAGVPTHISHLKAQGQGNWWKADAALQIIDQAAESGHPTSFDRYPYIAYSTGLSSLFPVWSREGGTDKFIERVNDVDLADSIFTAVNNKVNQLGNWNSVQITSTSNDSLSWARGKKLGDLARERGEDPYELTLRLINEDRASTGMVGFGMSERNTSTILSHPRGMICSDGGARATYGPLSEGTPHPRTYGSFPRILGYYCRDHRLMPLELAIHKMSQMPARLLKLNDRGLLAEGMAADVVIFDPDNVRDNATFEKPHQYPTGINTVLVNGDVVIRNEEGTGKRPGQVVTAG